MLRLECRWLRRRSSRLFRSGGCFRSLRDMEKNEEVQVVRPYMIDECKRHLRLLLS